MLRCFSLLGLPCYTSTTSGAILVTDVRVENVLTEGTIDINVRFPYSTGTWVSSIHLESYLYDVAHQYRSYHGNSPDAPSSGTAFLSSLCSGGEKAETADRHFLALLTCGF